MLRIFHLYFKVKIKNT